MKTVKQPDIALVIKNPSAVRKIKKPSLNVCLEAVMQDGKLLKFIPANHFARDSYNKICQAAVKSNPAALNFIDREQITSEDWRMHLNIAVGNNGLALRYIKEQTPELCLDAIKQNPNAFKYVDKTMCDKINSWCYSLLEKTAEEQKNQEKSKKKKQKPKKLKKIAGKINLLNAKKQTEKLCLKAVKQDGLQIRYVWNQTRNICRAAMKQNPEAQKYIRDDDMVRLDDMFSDISEQMGGFADSIEEYVFYCVANKAGKTPDTLKANIKNLTPLQYYKLCQKAIKENYCNIKYIKPTLLTDEQVKNLCLESIKGSALVLKYYINKMELPCELYYTICYDMIRSIEIFKLKCFKQIDSKLLSGKQYLSLVETLMNRSSDASDFTLQVIDPKKLSNKDYFAICKKVSLKSGLSLEKIDAEYLTREQYYEICLKAVKQNHYRIEDIDKLKLDGKEWMELCKIAVKKKGSCLYFINVTSKKDFKLLLNIALKNGGGLKYIEKQSYNQCLKVVKKDGYELENINPKNLSNVQYFNLCKTAVEAECQSLGYADDRFLKDEQYIALCKIALKSFVGTIRFINKDKIPPNTFLKWCKKAVSKNPYWIKEVPFSDQYYDLCLQAVEKDGTVIKGIKYLRLTKKQHQKLLKISNKNQKADTL